MARPSLNLSPDQMKERQKMLRLRRADERARTCVRCGIVYPVVPDACERCAYLMGAKPKAKLPASYKFRVRPMKPADDAPMPYWVTHYKNLFAHFRGVRHSISDKRIAQLITRHGKHSEDHIVQLMMRMVDWRAARRNKKGNSQ